MSAEHLVLRCPAVWLALNGRTIDSVTAGLTAGEKSTRAWTGRLLHQASFLAYSWEGLPSPGPE
eukprot:13999912-Alexandrium_andersonii.AAC.1